MNRENSSNRTPKKTINNTYIDAIVRIRGRNSSDSNISHSAITIKINKNNENIIHLKANNTEKEFQFNTIYDQYTTQNTLYFEKARGFVDKFVSGEPSFVAAVGVSGAGKSYTMIGGEDNEMGIIPRFIKDLFNRFESSAMVDNELNGSVISSSNEGDLPSFLAQGTELRFKGHTGGSRDYGTRGDGISAGCLSDSRYITIKCVEVFQKDFKSLVPKFTTSPVCRVIESNDKERQRGPVVLRNSQYDGQPWYSLTAPAYVVKDADSAISILHSALENRTNAPTVNNSKSSRSHMIIAIELWNTVTRSASTPSKRSGGLPEKVRVLESKATFFDFAGNERLMTGVAKSETTDINSTLSEVRTYLAQIAAAKQSSGAPVRGGKQPFCNLLSDALQYSNHSLIITNVSEAPRDPFGTRSALEFGCIMKKADFNNISSVYSLSRPSTPSRTSSQAPTSSITDTDKDELIARLQAKLAQKRAREEYDDVETRLRELLETPERLTKTVFGDIITHQRAMYAIGHSKESWLREYFLHLKGKRLRRVKESLSSRSLVDWEEFNRDGDRGDDEVVIDYISHLHARMRRAELSLAELSKTIQGEVNVQAILNPAHLSNTRFGDDTDVKPHLQHIQPTSDKSNSSQCILQTINRTSTPLATSPRPLPLSTAFSLTPDSDTSDSSFHQLRTDSISYAQLNHADSSLGVDFARRDGNLVGEAVRATSKMMECEREFNREVLDLLKDFL